MMEHAEYFATTFHAHVWIFLTSMKPNTWRMTAGTIFFSVKVIAK